MAYLQSIKERTPNASPSKPNLVPAHSHRGHCRHASGSNGPGGMGAALGAARNGTRRDARKPIFSQFKRA